MISGIIKTEHGFAIKDFETGKVTHEIGDLKFGSYMEAVDRCRGTFYPDSFYQYLEKASRIEAIDIDIWENLIYADDHRGVWDGERKRYHNVTELDKGAGEDDELAYVDALAFTYESLKAMAAK